MQNNNQKTIHPLEQRQRERFVRKSTQIADKYLKRMKAFDEIPEAMEPFFQVLENIYVKLEDVQRPDDMKTIGTFCVMVPNELIYAAGGMPVRLCSGNYTAYSIGDDTVPRDACPLVKAIKGSLDMGVMPIYQEASLMVVPVTCDCKKKLAGMLERIKPTLSLHVPSSKGEDEDIEQYLGELYRMIPILEQTTGNKITCESLADSINEIGYAQYEMSRFLTYRQNVPALLYGTHVIAIMNAYAYMSVAEWSMHMSKLNEELAERHEKKVFIGKSKKPRILVTGSPIIFPNIKVPLLIEEMGGILVGDETCMGERYLYNPPIVINNSFDGMMRALASRYIRPCTCPTFVDNSQRIYRIKQMIKDHKVQGVVYHVLRGCLVYDYEYQIFEEELGKMDIPVIRVESDYSEEDVEQLRIRIEAFIELIKLKEYAHIKNDKEVSHG